MKPRFYALKRNYMLMQSLPADELNAEAGRSGGVRANAGALRMSLALAKSGLSLNGRTLITTGPNAGRSIEVRARRLAELLARPGLLGQPESIEPAQSLARLAGRHGIVFFDKPHAEDGLIELLEPASTARLCQAANLFPLREIRFWPLT